MLESNNREIFIDVCSLSLSQSIGRGRIDREEALDVRQSRERRDKILAEKKNAKSGYNFKTGYPVTILGNIQAYPNRVLAQKMCVILRKRWPSTGVVWFLV